MAGSPVPPLLTGASVTFLIEHQKYPGCTMASLTIRERLEVIEAEARAAVLATLQPGAQPAGAPEPQKHEHRWPVLPNPTCGWWGCPGNEVEDGHEHCADCGAINPDSIYEDQRYRREHP